MAKFSFLCSDFSLCVVFSGDWERYEMSLEKLAFAQLWIRNEISMYFPEVLLLFLLFSIFEGTGNIPASFILNILIFFLSPKIRLRRTSERGEMLRAKTRKNVSQSFRGEKNSARNRETGRARLFETSLRHGREGKHTGNRQNTHFIPGEENRAHN